MTTDALSSYAEGVETFMATLYLTEQYSVVKIEGEVLRVQFPTERVSKQAGKVVRVPLNKVEQVMVLGDITLTTPAGPVVCTTMVTSSRSVMNCRYRKVRLSGLLEAVHGVLLGCVVDDVDGGRRRVVRRVPMLTHGRGGHRGTDFGMALQDPTEWWSTGCSVDNGSR